MGRENKPRPDAAGNREDFLARWSRRKLDAERVEPGADGGEIDTVKTTAPADEQAVKVLADADMPPIETLDGDSDYSPFLSPGVSDDMRHRAMRKLFGQPEFNVTDGLNDYDEDFTRFDGLGNVITHEMKRMLQRELEKDRALSTADTEPLAEPQSDGAVENMKENSANVETEQADEPEDTNKKSDL